LRGKKKQYENQLEKYSSRLRMSGFRKEISHQAIVELKASLDSVKGLWLLSWVHIVKFSLKLI